MSNAKVPNKGKLQTKDKSMTQESSVKSIRKVAGTISSRTASTERKPIASKTTTQSNSRRLDDQQQSSLQKKTTPTVKAKTETPRKSLNTTRTTATTTTAAAATKAPRVNETARNALANRKATTSNSKSNAAQGKVATLPSSTGKTTKTTVKSTAKPNRVLDTMHSVTVASPPTKRRAERNEVERREVAERNNVSVSKRERTRTRTLEAEEVVVLRNESAKQRMEAQLNVDASANNRSAIRGPVAFEVALDGKGGAAGVNARHRSRSRSKAREMTRQEDIDANYSDDFESYESDFETGESSSPASAADEEEDEESYDSQESSSNDDDINDDDDDGDDDDGDAEDMVNESENSKRTDINNDDEESEITQNPVTVIHRSREQKLDSGNYEMNSRKQLKDPVQQPESLETFSMITSEQMDSGISNFSASALRTTESNFNYMATYCGYKEFNTKPIFSSRGIELMSKIQFDTLTFTFLDMKPVSYEVYMQTYGKLNTRQSSTQTHENFLSTDCQTDDCDTRTVWTQHPPQYDLSTMQKIRNTTTGVLHSGTLFTQNCCGEFVSDEAIDAAVNSQVDPCDVSLQALTRYRQRESDRSIDLKLQGSHKQIDFERLHTFLLDSSMLIGKILSCNGDQKERYDMKSETYASISHGFVRFDASFLNALRVVRIFSNSMHNLVITVHESLPDADVYRGDFANLLMVWSSTETKKPIRLLSTWSEVCQAEICNSTVEFIICGLRDGSIAMWDMRETYSFCSKLDGCVTHFAATQSIVPVNGTKNGLLRDLGAVIDVKSFRKPTNFNSSILISRESKSIQFVSLNDTGLLTVWTLVEQTSNEFESAKLRKRAQSNSKRANSPKDTQFEYSSPWARAKLVQSAVCDLRAYFEENCLKSTSHFDKTKMLFEKNIYCDETLREIKGMPTGALENGTYRPGLRFTCIDVSTDLIYVCLNRNFILICSKSLKPERFRKISINEGRFLFPTALRLLTNEQFLAVGLSNGAVMLLNCDQKKQSRNATKSGSQRNSHGNVADNDEHARNQSLALNMEGGGGKSCAIQNIILNERRNDNWGLKQYDEQFSSRPTTAKCIDLIENKKRPFELHIFDQQIILSGSLLRKDLVQKLEISSDGWRLFSLSNGFVRVYDFYSDKEITLPHDAGPRVLDITVSKTDNLEQNLIILNQENHVEMHYLKQ